MPSPTDPNIAPQKRSHTSQSKAPGPELTIVVPTFNERNNVKELVRRLEAGLSGCNWEAVFVDDDSPDSTSDVVREVALRDHRIRSIQRIGRRGLSAACIEGLLSSSAPYLAVMDGDLQHDETLLPKMLATLKASDADIVIGSRYAPGGGVGNWDESRAILSRFAARLSQFVIKEDLTDPMSGFFMIRSEAFHGAVRDLSGVGFKIMLDLFASSPTPLRFEEIPYEFRNRQAGESKLDNQVAWEYGMLLLDKLVGHILPVRFVAFTLVGSLGVGVHLVAQAILFEGLNFDFIVSQACATLVAMTFNFAVNNVLTYRDMRLRGAQWLRGWLSFSVACSVGAFANVGIAAYIYSLNTKWVLAAICGIVVGAVWNYAVTMVYTWKKPRDSR
jgi:dolichol-phosphate mannosyltransferase